MARSRHGRTGGGSSPEGPGLPSWAQRHLDEAGEPALGAVAPAAPRHHRRPAEDPNRLRGWGVAIVAVAAAVGAVPLAISSLASDHSHDPLPRVDTYTAGSPGPLQADGGAGNGGRPRGDPAPSSPGGDAASAGVLDAPPAAPAGGARAAAAPALAAPLPAAVVRPTPPVLPPAATTAKTTPPTTADGEGRSATKPPTTSPSKPPKTSIPKPRPSGGGGSDDGGDGGSSGGGLVGNTLGGVTRAAGGVVNGVLGG